MKNQITASCPNCTGFYSRQPDACLNCGYTIGEIRREQRLFQIYDFIGFIKYVASYIMLASPLLALSAVAAGGNAARLGASITTTDLMKAAAYIGAGGFLTALLSFAYTTLKTEPIDFSRPGKNFPFKDDSIADWEKKLTERLKAVELQTDEMKKHEGNEFLSDEEKSGFARAAASCAENKTRIEKKLNSFAVIRWLNSVEHSVSQIYAENDAAKLEKIIVKIDILKPVGRAMLATALTDADRKTVDDAVNRLRGNKAEISRHISLAAIKDINIYDLADAAEDFFAVEREQLEASIELQESWMKAQVSTDMFKREEYRLEILALLDSNTPAFAASRAVQE